MKNAIRTVLLTAGLGSAVLAGSGEARAVEILYTSVNDVGDLEITFVDGASLGKALDYHFQAKFHADWRCTDLQGRMLFQPVFTRMDIRTIESGVRLLASREERTIMLNLPPTFVVQKDLQCPIGYAPYLVKVKYEEIQGWIGGTPVTEGQPVTRVFFHLRSNDMALTSDEVLRRAA
jgi:hypothetical protein